MKTLNFLAAAFLLFLTAFGSLATHAGTCQPSSLDIIESCPTANFSILNNGSPAGTPIRFTNLSSGATSYLWDFGDGTSSTDVNPAHVYGSAGNYTVKLYATFGGCTVEFIIVEEVVVN